MATERTKWIQSKWFGTKYVWVDDFVVVDTPHFRYKIQWQNHFPCMSIEFRCRWRYERFATICRASFSKFVYALKIVSMPIILIILFVCFSVSIRIQNQSDASTFIVKLFSIWAIHRFVCISIFNGFSTNVRSYLNLSIVNLDYYRWSDSRNKRINKKCHPMWSTKLKMEDVNIANYYFNKKLQRRKR